MADSESTLACPVCISTPLHQTPVKAAQPFVLDHCDNCGGTWFDAGEVMKLRGCSPQDVLALMANVEGVFKQQCRSCGALLDRNDEKCPACAKLNLVDCPRCNTTMERKQRGHLVLDLCNSCKGVWFDRQELQQIWKLAFNTVAKDAAQDPFVAWYGADVAAGLSSEGEIAPGVKLGDVANTTLGTIVKTVSTAFDPAPPKV